MSRAPMSRLDDWQLENDDQDIRGWPVRDPQGATLGTVTELIGNTDTGQVDTIVLDTGAEIDTSRIELVDGVVVLAAAPATSGDEVTVSEERLRVGTQQVPTGRIRLRKRVVTENVSETVPVARDEVRVQREPIDPAQRDRLGTTEVGEDEAEVTLTEQRPVVAKETVPVERVRVAKDTVTEEVPVTEQVAHEEVEVDESKR
jgi:uncharacterized protein (TIGR02271 family)